MLVYRPAGAEALPAARGPTMIRKVKC